MAEVQEIKATVRADMKKTALRAMRKTGYIPGILYGDSKPNENVTLEYKEIFKLMQTGNFTSTVYMLDVGGKKQRVLPKDVQVDPVRDFPLHVDFLRVSKSSRLEIEVPVRFLNEELSPGLKSGGILNVVRHTVELLCPADAIPEYIEVDLTGLEFGDTVHISAVKLPAGISPTITDRDFTIATIVAPDTLSADDAAGGEGEAGDGGE